MSFHQSDQSKWVERSSLPLGFRFHPTDEELVGHFLTQKVVSSKSVFHSIGEVNFNECEPWDLPAKTEVGDQSMFYFFSLRDKKYPLGIRANRSTKAGFWKATGRDREVVTRSTGKLLGMKKTLVFYTGRAPKGEKTNWIMHEYRLEDELRSDQQEWVVCRVFEKRASSKRTPPESNYSTGGNTQYSINQPCSFQPALPDLESPSSNALKPRTLSEPLCHFQGAGHGTILTQPNSTMNVRRELQFGDPFENLSPGWDMDSPLSIWDFSA